MLQTIAGREELSGSDVIVVHRMTKNNVKEKTGLGAYALITLAAVDAMGADKLCQSMTDHTETYEHIGDVSMVVHDIKSCLENMQAKRKIDLTPENAWHKVEVTVPIPPATVWEYLVMGQYKTVWMEIESVTIKDEHLTPKKQSGITYHCHHKGHDMYHTVVDWKPFSYISVYDHDWKSHWATQLTPTKKGTKVTWLFEKFIGIKEKYWENTKKMVSRGGPIVKELVEKEIASGKIKPILDTQKSKIEIPKIIIV